MIKMKKTVYYYDKRMSELSERIIKFKANTQFGFYFNEKGKLILLSKFAENVARVSIIAYYDDEEKEMRNYRGKYEYFGDGFIKIKYCDGSVKILEYKYNTIQEKFEFFEMCV